MNICRGDLTDPCVRELWATLPPVAFVVLLIVLSLPIPIPRFVSRGVALIRAPFLPTLTLVEAEELEHQFAVEDGVDTPRSEPRPSTHEAEVTAPQWRTALFRGLTAIELMVWLTLGVVDVIHATRHSIAVRSFVVLPCMSFLVALTWAYAFARVLHRPPVTPPFDLFILLIAHLAGGVLTLGGQLYSHATWDALLPPQRVLAVEGIHLCVLLILLTLILSLPLNVRSDRVDMQTTPALSPEDYTSLAGWITFTWVRPLIAAGTGKKLIADDVWDLSPTLKARPTFFAFKQTPGSKLLWRLIRANSMDLFIDFALTEMQIVLEFAGPVFLRGILQGLENPEEGSRSRLYLYAVLAFMANMLKGQAELQHLWYGRRAGLRVGTQLSAAIYEKALRIVDQSGASSAATDSKSDKEEKNDNEKGADIGKIVNLMGIDAQKIQSQITTMPNIYRAPVQLILSCIYLYKLLGVSAFAGFFSLLLVIPLSQYLASVVMRLTKHTLAAKDARMKLINEMFGSIKSFKFFAWEQQWIAKIMEARMVEMKWLKKGRNVNIFYTLLWLMVPSLISISSFFVFVMTGHQLTVSIAFTAIRVFDLMKVPLDMLPYAMITLAQGKVSLDRLTAFFNEDEVPEDVCGLTRPTTTEPQELRVKQATFRWSGSPAGLDTEKSAPAPASGLATPSSSESEAEEEEVVASSASTSSHTIADQENQVFELKDISVSLASEKLTVITGATASGKTALLMALLGEMDRVSGTASIPKNPTIVDEHGLCNSISYAAQTPWLQQQSIKSNIVFQYPFDQKRYEAVVEACALAPDFRALEDGDLTEVGSQGVSLSGGQKARVALARAVYAPTQYLILDDIFSAVDSHTARFLFERLLKGPLVAHRTVLLVTHHVELVLPGTHYLIQMSEGRIYQQGTVEELKEQGHLEYIAHDTSMHPRHEKEAQVGAKSRTQLARVDSDSKPKQARKLVEEEVRSEGSVKWAVYRTYLKAASYLTCVCVLLGIVAGEVCNIGTRVWMSIWGTAYEQAGSSLTFNALYRAAGHYQSFGDPWPVQHLLVFQNVTMARNVVANSFPDAHEHALFYVAVYSGLGLTAAFVAATTQWILFTGGLRSGLVLFRKLLTRLSGATFRFCDTTPMGRILNRFGKDFDTIDATLPFMLYQMATSLAAFIGAVITVSAIVPGFLPVGALLAYCYVRLSIGYLDTGRDLRRMESTSRSPILAGFSDLVSGIVTVRAFSAERQFLNAHHRRVDTCQRFWYFTWMLNRWLLLNFDALGTVSVFSATIFVLAGYVPVGYAALSIVSAMTFSSSVYWTCRGYTDLELCLNSVERVVEFLDVPQEAPAIIENRRVPAYWPSNSDSDSLLVVENLEVKYAPDLPPVIHNVSFALKARERVGLLGRTGCGKSTLAMSLLRFVEPVKGRIIIDGTDITTIGTHDLRSRVTFIPQDATLFAGTIRDNLDPFNEHSDTECLDALARVQLIMPDQKSPRQLSQSSSIESFHGCNSASSSVGSETATESDTDSKIIINLDTTVSAGGQNFSNGQRQLLAMARALLRQSAVVILDEATSSIDKAADIQIQAAIREEFNHSLLLTIAHRLETIIDFDRLIVLDKGHIVEFDTPFNLIQKEGGVFREMCIQSGTFKELEAAAMTASLMSQ